MREESNAESDPPPPHRIVPTPLLLLFSTSVLSRLLDRSLLCLSRGNLSASRSFLSFLRFLPWTGLTEDRKSRAPPPIVRSDRLPDAGSSLAALSRGRLARPSLPHHVRSLPPPSLSLPLSSSARIPVLNAKDVVESCPESTHIAVLCRGTFYYFSCLHSNGDLAVDTEDLRTIMEAILEDAEEMNKVRNSRGKGEGRGEGRNGGNLVRSPSPPACKLKEVELPVVLCRTQPSLC